MDSRGYTSVGLAGFAGFLIFLGGWSIFSSSVAASEIGFSSDWFVEGVPILSFLESFLILFGGTVCAFLAWRYSPESWPSVKTILVLVLVILLVAQVVYAYGGNNLSPGGGNGGGGGIPPSVGPSLSGSYQLFANDVALSDNVPFGIYYNGVRIGGDARITINADLVLKGYTGSPGEVQFPIDFAYAPMISGQWAAWTSFPVVVTVPNPMWVRSGSDWKASIRNLAVTTISGTDSRFFYSAKKCRFKLSVYATLGGTLSTRSSPTEFILESRAGSLEIEYAGGWAS